MELFSYKGSMTITLSNGLSTTIPNHELIQPFRDFDFDGNPVITKPKKNILMLNSLQSINAKDLPLLGIPFLSSTYLVVDSDQGQFQLGESIPSSSQALVPGAHSQCTQSSSAATATQDSQATGSSTTTPEASPTGSSSHSGILIGAAVAVIVVVLAAVAVAVILYKRLKKRNPGDIKTIQSPIEEEGLKSSSYELSSHSQHAPSIYEADSTPIQQIMDSRM